jgi:hypothetical protein
VRLGLSGWFGEHVSSKLPDSFSSLGPQTLKNIDRPIHVYRLAGKNDVQNRQAPQSNFLFRQSRRSSFSLCDMSADPEQPYFVDGMTEDLITDLSKVADLFVIARTLARVILAKLVMFG